MATYTKQARKKGTAWRAQVRKRVDGVLHSEARTFSSKTRAKAWAEKRERELEDPEHTRKTKDGNTVLAKILEDYVEEVGQDFERTKRQSLERITGYELAQNPVGQLTTEKILAHLRWRRQTVAPSTAGSDLIWIKAALTHARDAWGMVIDLSPLESASAAARRARLIASSRSRDRRPTTAEIEKLRTWFNRPRVGNRSKFPMADIMDFAIASARRENEIVRLRWSDLDTKKGTCLLRDVKSPTGSKGNHRTFALTKEALAIIKRQPRTSEYIFPYTGATIGKYFGNAQKLLGIEDLRFHDLRHEATSRLFEAGYQIHEVQQFTLHESWATLQRYTQLKAEDVANR